MRNRFVTLLIASSLVVVTAGAASAERPVATVVNVPHRDRLPQASTTKWIMFLQRHAHVLHGAQYDDSTTWTSSIASGEVNFPEWQYSEASWQAYLHCMQAMYG